MLIVFLGMIVLFLVLGLTFSRGKGAFLIAGYNTASKAEKARYDEKALCRFMGKIMFALAGCQGIMALELERSGGYGKIGAGNPRLLRF